MTLTAFLAQLFGIYAGVAMIIRRRSMLEVMNAFPEQRPLIFILAMIRILIGLSVVLAHNRWAGTLPIVVTLIGWLTLLRGIALLLLPANVERKALTFFEQNNFYYAAVMIVFGLWLTYAAYITT